MRTLPLPEPVTFADATDGGGRRFGVTREIHDIADAPSMPSAVHDRLLATERALDSQQQGGPPGSASAENDRNASGIQRGQHTALERGAFDDHDWLSRALAIGIRIPVLRAVSIANGYPASACLTTPLPGSSQTDSAPPAATTPTGPMRNPAGRPGACTWNDAA